MRDIEAEGLLRRAVPFHEIERIPVDQVRGVAVLARLLPAVPPIVDIVVADMADEIDVAAVVAAEIVESMILRVKFGIAFWVAHVPFADYSSSVSVFLE